MSTTQELTKKQTRVLAYICRCIDTEGCPPTVRMIGEKFKISSPNGVQCHLQALAKKGYIRVIPNRACGIRVLRRLEAA